MESNTDNAGEKCTNGDWDRAGGLDGILPNCIRPGIPSEPDADSGKYSLFSVLDSVINELLLGQGCSPSALIDEVVSSAVSVLAREMNRLTFLRWRVNRESESFCKELTMDPEASDEYLEELSPEWEAQIEDRANLVARRLSAFLVIRHQFAGDDCSRFPWHNDAEEADALLGACHSEVTDTDLEDAGMDQGAYHHLASYLLALRRLKVPKAVMRTSLQPQAEHHCTAAFFSD